MNSPFSLRRASRIVRLPAKIVNTLVDVGVVTPARGPRGALEFSFHDLTVLRALSQAPAASLRHGALRLHAAQGRRLVARAARPVIVEPDGSAWDAESGQVLIEFDAPEAGAARVLVFPDDDVADESLLDEALALESVDPTAAMRTYRLAIAADAACEEAYLNLGALLEQRDDLEGALEVYLEGAAQCPASALLRFNCAVGLQLLSSLQEAERWYHAALGLDPTLADAHHNLSLIYLEIGDERRAIRHYNEERRLERPQQRR